MNKLLYRGQLIFKDVSWKCTKAVGNENTNQAMQFKIEIIKWQNKVNTHFKQCFKLNPLTKL